ncbi:YafY family transcriptional regulator [Terrisporobacter petrolearius]|uniref:helix-turn-helix transcriptional regulator n=1 Tax=Terrisporobacter petrolearius TaxID=1460447 RepID=UPI001D16377D|nr:YafY family protein [Terrisporobacter petrolearius]MCC3866256.1 YafY family transcriptional regulator [Terrisporobacter petrolearius]
MAKIDNMMLILWMLSSDKKVTAKEISEKLEINIRTVYRYMDTLCASGVPIISDSGHNGGYTLLNNFVEAPLFFHIEEQTALLHAAMLAKEAGYFFNEELDKATSKIKMYSNQEQEKVLNQHLAGFEVIKPIGKSSVESLLKKLEHNIVNKLSVEIKYCTGSEGKVKERLIDPYGIVYWNNNWYLVAFCHLRNEIRNFRVDRIISTIDTQIAFNPPEPFSSSKFFMKTLLEYKEDKKGLRPLIIGGKRNALDNLCQNWFLAHRIKERNSNEVIFLLQEEVIYKYVPNLIIPYGKSIEIIEPLKLKEKMIEALKELIEYYQV